MQMFFVVQSLGNTDVFKCTYVMEYSTDTKYSNIYQKPKLKSSSIAHILLR